MIIPSVAAEEYLAWHKLYKQYLAFYNTDLAA
jgi:hypothetical protein